MKKDDILKFVYKKFRQEGSIPEPVLNTSYSTEIHCERQYRSTTNRIKDEAKKFYMYTHNIDDVTYSSPSINYDSDLLYQLIQLVCAKEDFDYSFITPLIDKFVEINNIYSYFKKVEIDNKKLNNNFDNYFNKDKVQLKEFVFGKAYYCGLSKYRNNLRGGNTNYSNLKLKLTLITVDRINYELAFKVSLPLLSTKKIYSLIPITGPDRLKATLIKKACDDFHKAFRSHVITIIAGVNKLKRKEKKELLNLSDSELADLYLVADMQSI